MEALDRSHQAVLVAPTGAGKTTRVPRAIMEVTEGEIWLIVPRRLAARAAAARMASEDGTPLGTRIGYVVRDDQRRTAATRIVVMTEGVALRRLQEDPFATDVSAIVLDEFHERSTNADLLFAFVREVRAEARDDLLFVVMSATIDAARVSAAMGDAPVIQSAGRTWPVDISYEPGSTDDQTRTVVGAVLSSWARHDGHTLVFVPGVGEIERCTEALEGARARIGGSFQVAMLHGSMDREAQDAAIAHGEIRRIIIATNVAETSVTVPGVTCVIDTGLERVMRYDAGVGMNRLELVRASRSSADQRAGRAGRERPGVCLRLWSEATQRALDPEREPEILRTELSGVVLQVALWGCAEPTAFGWFEPPPSTALAQAEALLARIGARDGAQLTQRGRRLAELPLSPRVGRLLLEAEALGASRHGAIAAALLDEREIVRREATRDRSRDADTGSDIWDRILAIEGRAGRWGRADVHGAGAARIRRTAARLERLIARGSRPDRGTEDERIARAVLAAYPDRVARRRGTSDRGVMVGGRGVRLSPGSGVVTASLFVCAVLEAGARGASAESWVQLAVAVEPEWLDQDQVSTRRDVVVDAATGVVTAWTVRAYADLELGRTQVGATDDEAGQALLDAVGDSFERALGLDTETAGGWWARAQAVGRWRPELGIADALETSARSVLARRAQRARRRDALSAPGASAEIMDLLPWDARQAVERLAPARVRVASGRDVALDYTDPDRPVLAVKLQELFGTADSPTVDDGRRRVVLHLLSPNGRPVQITDDLRSFWDRTYPEVRRDLRARYAKHPWPEDPWTAQATARTKRRT